MNGNFTGSCKVNSLNIYMHIFINCTWHYLKI